MNQTEVIKKLVERSWTDAQFKAEFIADPVAVIEKEVGHKVDLKGKEIVVMDQSDANTYYLNLSRYVNMIGLKDKELTDEQLEVVAGGMGIHSDCTGQSQGVYCEEFDDDGLPIKGWDQIGL